MNLKISTQWTPFERRYVIGLLEKKLEKPILPDDIETTLRKISRLQDLSLSATALEADSEWLLQGLGVERA